MGFPQPEVMVVKDRMASQEVLQVVTLLPADLTASRRQPRGVRRRRAGGEDVKRKVVRVARDLQLKGHLSEQAADYLIGWASGTLQRAARPDTYAFLSAGLRGMASEPVIFPSLALPPGRMVVVQGPGRRPLPPGPESGDEAEPGPLVEMGP